MKISNVSFYLSYSFNKKDKKVFVKNVEFLNKKLDDKRVLEVLLGEKKHFYSSFSDFIVMLHYCEDKYEQLGIVEKEREKFDALIKNFKNNYANAIYNYLEKMDLPLEDKAEKIRKAYLDCKSEKEIKDRLFPLCKKYAVERAEQRENKLNWEGAGQDWSLAGEYLRGATCFKNASCYDLVCTNYVNFLDESDYDTKEEKRVKELIWNNINEWMNIVHEFLQKDPIIIEREWEAYKEKTRYCISIEAFMETLYTDYLDLNQKLKIAKELSNMISTTLPYEQQFADLYESVKKSLDYCIAKGEFIEKT